MPVYRTIVPLIQATVPRSYIPIDFTLLPNAITLEKYLNNSIQVLTATEQGFSMKFYSPCGLYTLPIISKLLELDFDIQSK